MKKQFTKTVSIILSLIMLCTVMPLTAFSETTVASGTCGDNLTWTLDSEGTLTVSGTGEMYDYTGTSTDVWHEYRAIVTNVKINSGVTSIGEYAFFAFTSLENVTFGDDVETISRYAFYDCTALESVYIPANVKLLEDRAFGDCENIKSIHIGDGDIVISDGAFNYCNSLESLYIEGASEIHLGAFDAIPTMPLESITILSDDCVISDDYSDFADDIIFYCKSGSTTAKYAADASRPFVPIDETDFYVLFRGDEFEYDNSSDIEVLLTKNGVLTISGIGKVTGFGTWSLLYKYHNMVTKIVVKNGITYLYGFDGFDKVSTFYIPGSVSEIRHSAFEECISLSDVYYAGTEEEWALIEIGSGNEILNNATIHYNCCSLNAYSEHSFTSEVTEPTCKEQGYTTYTCECGYSYSSDYTEKLTHSYSSSVTKYPSHTQTGIRKYTCTLCGDYYTETIEKLEKHTYKKVVTAPTCTEQGYTTYTCACGDSYVSDYVDAKCHSYTSSITLPTCTEQGYTTYTCACGDSYVDNYVDADPAAHTDENGDDFCDDCGIYLKECNCNCHKSGFVGFFWKIINFFNRIFGLNPVCECGKAHY